MVKNGPNRSKWFKMLQNFLISQKLSKMVQHGPKLSNMNVFLCFPYGSGKTRSPGIFPTLALFPVLLKANAARNCHLSWRREASTLARLALAWFWREVETTPCPCGWLYSTTRALTGSHVCTITSLHTVYYTLHTVHCTLHTVHFTLHTANCTLQTAHLIMCTVHYTLHIANCTRHTACYTLRTFFFIIQLCSEFWGRRNKLLQHLHLLY